jgi:hypothetical protein
MASFLLLLQIIPEKSVLSVNAKEWLLTEVQLQKGKKFW